MSRNAPIFNGLRRGARWGMCLWLAAGALQAGEPVASAAAAAESRRARVTIVHDPQVTDAFKPNLERVREMVRRALTNLTGQTTTRAAWLRLVKPGDVIGIKVFSAPGPDSGTRPAVVAAIIEGLLEAQFPPTNIIVWDRQRADLRRAGYMALSDRYGVRVEGSVNAGYDELTFYSPERPILGQLVYGDLEFGQKGENVGRKSYVSRLLTHEITRLINVTPLLNHNTAGVNGHLFSLVSGSVDNFIRFEHDLFRLSTAVPEIYALPTLMDRVVLNVTDALVCQYQGEQVPLLHYATPLNELRFSTDAVALDLLSLRELEKARAATGTAATRASALTNQVELLQNAALLELGVADLDRIQIDRVR